ncbi:MAG: hypothetical protein OEY70_14850 [Acidimicrobiia bacterium]|nr:hypothetical protein [Acidimicrobiia bacterium]
MSDDGPSRKLLILLGLSVLLAGGYYGRALIGGGGEGGEPGPDPSIGAVSYTTEAPAGTQDPVAWVLPEQPRNPFQAVPLGP